MLRGSQRRLRNRIEPRRMASIGKMAPQVASLVWASVVTSVALAGESAPTTESPSWIEGKSIAFDAGKGNCLACHQIGDGESPGDLGPALIAIAARFPDKKLLRAQLWDATQNDPNSRMPPFGRHRLLTEEEIDKVVEFIYSL
jgi:sulfur-oxidizing protein SoxX